MTEEPKIYTTAEWGAKPPSGSIAMEARPRLVVEHHTEWHADNTDGNPTESLQEAFALARAIQQDHMHRDPPFVDSGHNFLVTRSGHILEGRKGSLAAIRAGRIVHSAHAKPGKNANLKPGANDQPGIEHEQKGKTEPLTKAQKDASVALHVFICRRTGIKPSEFYPHHKFSDTDCPGPVESFIPELTERVADALKESRPAENGSEPAFAAWLDWAQWRLGRGPFKGHRADPHLRPKSAPKVIPQSWWKALKKVTG